MAKPLHDYDVDAQGRVTDPSEPGGRPARWDDIQDQYNGLDIGQSNPGQGDDEYYWGPRGEDGGDFETDDDRWGSELFSGAWGRN
jgi:hypothetical protein